MIVVRVVILRFKVDNFAVSKVKETIDEEELLMGSRDD